MIISRVARCPDSPWIVLGLDAPDLATLQISYNVKINHEAVI